MELLYPEFPKAKPPSASFYFTRAPLSLQDSMVDSTGPLVDKREHLSYWNSGNPSWLWGMLNSSRIAPSGPAIPTWWALQPTSTPTRIGGYTMFASLVGGKLRYSSRASRLHRRATPHSGRHHPGGRSLDERYGGGGISEPSSIPRRTCGPQQPHPHQNPYY